MAQCPSGLKLVELHETTVVPYLEALDLSPEGREALIRVLGGLGAHGDQFAREPERRLTPKSDCFRVEWVFRDPISKVIHELRLIVSDAAAQYGVLRVVYAEDFASGEPSPRS
jgi:hypothetical protein